MANCECHNQRFASVSYQAPIINSHGSASVGSSRVEPTQLSRTPEVICVYCAAA